MGFTMKVGMIVLGFEYPSMSNARTDFGAPAAEAELQVYT